MQVETVTTQDRTLLRHVRRTLAESKAALMCVAFVQERGVHLIADEMKALRGGVRLLATTTFATTAQGALGLASELGAEIKILNPRAGSFHPKIYLGMTGDDVQAVIGSANLTGGLASNVEAGVWMKGCASDQPLARVRDFAEQMWNHADAQAWKPSKTELGRETFEPELYEALAAAVKRSPEFLTLGSSPRPNRVIELTRAEMFVETGRSREKVGGAQPIPAWMFNLAWEYLRNHGELTNTFLLNELRVHRSSAVCAILSRLPGVERAKGKTISLMWSQK